MIVSNEVAAVLSSPNPGVAFLFKFDFASATKRTWTGFGQLRTLDGALWEGLGENVSIDGMSPAMSTAAPAGRLGISGVSADVIATAIGEQDEYQQRPVQILLQAFEDRQLVGNPCPLALRIMTSMPISRQGNKRTIAINHESPYVGRNNPANGNYSDRDQQRRFPGDRICERVPGLLFHSEGWPTYTE